MSGRPALALLLLAGCGGASPVRLELDLADGPCADVRCRTRLAVTALVVPADDPGPDELARVDGEEVIVADFGTPWGSHAFLELAGEGEDARVRYRELVDGAPVFEGEAESLNLRLERPGGVLTAGRFDFELVDGEDRRVVTEGRIGQPRTAGPVSGGPSPSPRPRPTPAPAPTPTPTPAPSPAPGPWAPDPDLSVDPGCDPPPDTADDGGCDGGDSGGCDAPESDGGGCEGDTADGGCDADSSAGGCDCEGDTALAASGRRRGRAASGLWRLGWPIALVGVVNRRSRRRAARSASR